MKLLMLQSDRAGQKGGLLPVTTSRLSSMKLPGLEKDVNLKRYVICVRSEVGLCRSVMGVSQVSYWFQTGQYETCPPGQMF